MLNMLISHLIRSNFMSDYIRSSFAAFSLVLFVTIPRAATAQCNTQSLPYENYFSTTGALQCWNDSLGTLTPIIFGTRARINGINTGSGGTAVLISPPIYVDNAARLTYSWVHINNNQSAYFGINDSLHVSLKRTTDSSWTILKNYPFPFKSPYDTLPFFRTPPINEDFEIDSSYVNDTILVRFDFYAGANAQYLYLDNFKIEADNHDSIYALPFQENFDGSVWRPDSGSGVSNQLYKMDEDWRFVHGQNKEDNGMKWVVTDDSTHSSGTGPLSDYSGNGNYVYSESSYTSLNALMYLPPIDLSGSSYPQLSFWYHMRGPTMGTLNIEYYNNSSWITLDSIEGQQQILATEPWKKNIFLLDSGGVTRIRLRMRSNWSGIDSFKQDAAIDEIEISGVSCPIPNDFTASFINHTSNSVTANWSNGPNSNSYILEYGLSGFNPGSGQLDTTNSTSTTINGLLPNSLYDVYFRFVCGTGDTSYLKGPYSFQTKCASFLAPYTESFNDTLIPSCWFAHNQLTPDAYNSQWLNTKSGFPAYGANGKVDHTGNGGYAVGVDGSFPYPMDSIALRTPFINVSLLKEPELRFWIFSDNIDHPGENNTLKVDCFNGTQWLNSVLTYEADSSDWVQVRLQLDSLNISGDIRFRLVIDKDSLNAAYFNDIIVDDISIIDGYGLDCPIPDSIQFSQIHCDSATISWTTNPSNSFTRLKYGPPGFDFDTSGIWINNVTSPFTLHGLSKGTDYEVYVVDSCTEGFSLNSAQFTTDSALLPVINYTSNVLSYTDTSVTYVFDARNTTGGNTFKWDFGNGNIVYGDSVPWTYYTNYSNAVSLDVENSCGVSSTWFTVLVNNIDILEMLSQNSSISIYPNPSHGEFTIELEGLKDEVSDLTVFNELGVVVYKQEVKVQSNNTQIELNLSGSKPGLYFLVLQNGKEVKTTQKLLIQ